VTLHQVRLRADRAIADQVPGSVGAMHAHWRLILLVVTGSLREERRSGYPCTACQAVPSGGMMASSTLSGPHLSI
jgi:hypothetical protein